MPDQAAIELEPIGTVRSPWTDPSQAPRQGSRDPVEMVIELDPRWQESLSGLTPGRWLWVITHLGLSQKPQTMVRPRRDPQRETTGLFNTRAPCRPCPLGLTLARLVAMDGNRLTVRGLDAVDGTRVLDLKPYVPAIDAPWETP